MPSELRKAWYLNGKHDSRSRRSRLILVDHTLYSPIRLRAREAANIFGSCRLRRFQVHQASIQDQRVFLHSGVLDLSKVFIQKTSANEGAEKEQHICEHIVIIFKRSIGQCNIGTARAWDISLKTLKNAKVASILSHPGVSDHSKKSRCILLNLLPDHNAKAARLGKRLSLHHLACLSSSKASELCCCSCPSDPMSGDVIFPKFALIPVEAFLSTCDPSRSLTVT